MWCIKNIKKKISKRKITVYEVFIQESVNDFRLIFRGVNNIDRDNSLKLVISTKSKDIKKYLES